MPSSAPACRNATPSAPKRLNDVYSRAHLRSHDLSRDNQGEWQPIEDLLRSRGCNLPLVLHCLAAAHVRRKLHEDGLKRAYSEYTSGNPPAPAGTTGPSPRLSRAVRYLLRSLETEAVRNPAISAELRRDARALLLPLLAVTPDEMVESSGLPAHRPRDPWLVPLVRGLGVAARHSGLSWRKTYDLVHRIIVAAGHGDLLTRNAIRHTLRLRRIRLECLGEPGPHPGSPWRASSPDIPSIEELGSLALSPPQSGQRGEGQYRVRVSPPSARPHEVVS